MACDRGFHPTPALRRAAGAGHLYELMPIAVLIGTIFALARLAQSSSSPSCALAAWARARLRCWRCQLGWFWGGHLRHRRLRAAGQRTPAHRGHARGGQAAVDRRRLAEGQPQTSDGERNVSINVARCAPTAT